MVGRFERPSGCDIPRRATARIDAAPKDVTRERASLEPVERCHAGDLLRVDTNAIAMSHCARIAAFGMRPCAVGSTTGDRPFWRIIGEVIADPCRDDGGEDDVVGRSLA